MERKNSNNLSPAHTYHSVVGAELGWGLISHSLLSELFLSITWIWLIPFMTLLTFNSSRQVLLACSCNSPKLAKLQFLCPFIWGNDCVLCFTLSESEMFFWYLTYFNCWNLFHSNQRHLFYFLWQIMQTPVSRPDTTTSYVFLENKTSPERERILTSSSWKGAKHPVEQREQLKGELIHQMLHDMRIGESKLSINQVHCVQSGKRCPSPCTPSQQRTGSCGRKYIFKLN